MEEKLMRPRETALVRTQSKSEQNSVRSNSISCGETVNYGLSNSHWRTQNRNSNIASNSGPFPAKMMPQFYRHAQSTGNQAVAEKNSTLLTTPNQSFPLTTASVYANLSNVRCIEHETNPRPRVPAPYDGFIEDTCGRKIASPVNNPETFEIKCRVCKKKLQPCSVRYHAMAVHPEVFFAEIQSSLAMQKDANFSAYCLIVLKGERDLGKRLMKEEVRKGYKKWYKRGIWCTYCNNEKREPQYFKLHLFRYHYDNLKNMVKACCSKSKLANVTIACSERVPNTESTTRREFDQNTEPRQKPNVRFAYNVGRDVGKEIASSDVNGQTCSATVNMKRDLLQNLDYQNTQEYRWQGFAQAHKSNFTNTLVGNTSSTWFTTATSTDEGRHGGDFHYGNATAWWNGQAAGLGAGPNLCRNGPIPNVSAHHLYASFPNHFSQAGISSITESSNNVNMVMANQIQQYYSTTMAPDNWQYFHPPAPVDEQHRVESNQQVLASDSSQMYSVYPQGSNGIIMHGVPDWEAFAHCYGIPTGRTFQF